MVTCAAFGCSNSTKSKDKKSGVTFHSFPQNQERRTEWIRALKRESWSPSAYSRVCSSHFKEEDIDRTSLSYVRIREHGVPSIFPAFPVYMQPTQTIARPPRKRKNSQSDTPSTSNIQEQAGPSTSSLPGDMEVETNMDMEVESNLPDTPRRLRKMVKEQNVLIKRKNVAILTRDRCIARIRQRSYRAGKRVTKLKNIIKDLKDKFNVGQESCSMLEGISQTSNFLVRRQIQKSQGKKLKKKYDEKLRSFALSLHYISPRAYEYVRQQFDTCLPHPKTLARWYKTVNAEPGFCTEAFNAIKLYCNANDGPILASLMVDSMSIKQDVKWDGTKHVGYVNFGVDYNDDSVPHAKEALVFLLNCINGSWKYPIAYFFVAGISGEQLAGLIRQCLTFLSDTGITVTSLTFDGAAANISMATNLGCCFDPDNLKTYFLHPETGDKVYAFLDPCHMLKLVRNTIGERNLESKDGVVSWQYIQQLFKLQDSEGLRLANKLTKGHINWQDQKMKVKLAAQALSESVAKAIEFCREKKMSPFVGSEATCHFIEKFNKLFDILNSRSMKSFGPKKALNVNNFQDTKEFFHEMASYIKELKNKNGGQLVKSNRKVGCLGFL
ncbi:hypothetical protein WDU94_007611, partial [Cyamophila willieti]